MKKIIIISFLLLLFLGNNFAQDTNVIKYLPLKVGNTWVYKWNNYRPFPPLNDSGTYSARITDTFSVSGKKYFHFAQQYNGIAGCPFDMNLFQYEGIRVDSVSGNVYAYTNGQGCPGTPNETIIDSLKMRLYDSVNYNCFTTFRPFCGDTTPQNLFGNLRQSKILTWIGVESGSSRRAVNGFGPSYFGKFVMYWQCNYTLKGCVIDGIVYGDTSFILGINKISSIIPDKYKLFQNYPNPFNPTTHLRFEIPNGMSELRFVSLQVYDVLGREVQTLVNEQLSPGTYEVEWDGSNFSSGVYYYTLSVRQAGSSTGEYAETKKMILMK